MLSFRGNPFVQAFAVLFVGGGLIFDALFIMKVGAAFVFFAMLFAIARSAVSHRNNGWVAALLYVGLVLTIPLWVLGTFALCENLGLLGR